MLSGPRIFISGTTDFGEQHAHDRDDQVQYATDSCVKLWRYFTGAICHFCFSLTLQPLLIHEAVIARGTPRDFHVFDMVRQFSCMHL